MQRLSASRVQVRDVTWPEAGLAIRAVRDAVFIQEQSVPAELQRDSADADRLDVLAYDERSRVLTTSRL